MTPTLYAHPFSSYCQKVIIAFYERDMSFDLAQINGPDDFDHLGSLWLHRKMPVLTDGDETVVESSIIIEYLDQHYWDRNPLIPADPRSALQARFMDRYFDLYVMTPMQKIVGDSLQPENNRDPEGVRQAKDNLTKAYEWLESHLGKSEWAAGEQFTIADCAAAPALFYADWVHRIPQSNTVTTEFRKKLLARASVKRAVDEARPYRDHFPLGAPDRD